MSYLKSILSGLALGLALAWPGAALPDADQDIPRIAIILDDLGYNRPSGERALQLPGNITYAIIPFTPYAKTFANEAYRNQREVMLHMPMESTNPDRKLDQGGLAAGQTEQQVRARVRKALDAVPHITGLNNHMGSNVTADNQIMDWLMQEVTLGATLEKRERPLFFIDSMTHPRSVAGDRAAHFAIPTLKRDIFLDNVQSEAAVNRMFNALISLARERGHAVAIGHPYPVTLDYLERKLPELQDMGVELVKASELVAMYGTPVDQPVDVEDLMQTIIALPAPESQRLNFSNENLYAHTL